MSPTKGTPTHSVRVPPELWDRAATVAAERGETLSDVIRRALEQYVTPSHYHWSTGVRLGEVAICRECGEPWQVPALETYVEDK